MRRLLPLLVSSLLLWACGDRGPEPGVLPRELQAPTNPFGPQDSLWSAQPRRERPMRVVGNDARGELYVALHGTETDPMREVAIVDATSLKTLARVEVGPGPMGMALHPDGRHLFVTLRYASYAAVVDLETRRVVREVSVPFYTEAVALSRDGDRAFLLNRWTDSLLRWRIHQRGSGLEIASLDPAPKQGEPLGVPMGANPKGIVLSEDGEYLLVNSESDMSLTLLRTEDLKVVGHYRPNSPVIDVAVIGDHAFLLHIGSGSNHPPDTGFDGDDDGHAGDHTANVGFQDVQNEIDVVSIPDLERLHRYTSDSICCRDYRDVNPMLPDSGMDLLPIDQWPPSRAAFMPDRKTWIVAGAMPERVVPVRREDGSAALAVVYAGSSEVQTFDVDPASGALSPRETAETGLYPTGFGAHDAVAVDGGRRLVVVDHLGETLTGLDLHGSVQQDVVREVVGDVSDGAFPATDAELGEAFNTMTAAFTVDGDQTCVHCHRDGTPVPKAVSMPLLETPEWGARLIMTYRNGYDSRPWFVEVGMNEENFFPVINEFDRKENFCCEGSDTRIWSDYPQREECLKDSSLSGCNHVLDCVNDPPPQCAQRNYGVAALTRDRHFQQAAQKVLGRSESFGDALFSERVGEDGSIKKRPIKLGFSGITRALGLFLLSQSRELPNPNAAQPSGEAQRGERIYHSSEAGCAVCHPLPVGATAHPTVVSEAPGPIGFPYVVTPRRHPESGQDMDRVNPAFLGTFPAVRQGTGGLRVGVPSLRGAWDRQRFLHDGRARDLLSVLATPGHPALAEGQLGFNVNEGQPNTHGGTSELSARDLRALEAFVNTL